MARVGLVAGAAFLLAVAADLGTKAYAVAHRDVIVYNDARPSELGWRGAVLAATIGVAYLFSRRLGRLWATWAFVGVLAGGTIANGVSRLVWSRGVPDFIHNGGGEAWNVADFEIAVGLAGGVLSIALAALVRFALERRRARGVTSAT